MNIMVRSKEEIQEEWDEYENKREERRKIVLQDLQEELDKDNQLLLEKEKKLQNLKRFTDSLNDSDQNLELLQNEVKEIKKRIKSNEEIKRIIDNKHQEYKKHGDMFDDILDRSFESHGGISEGTRQATLPLRGAGLVILMEIRERYYKWKEKEEPD
jgi:DNA repair exonuclease SbcCD ATPase subunit